MPPGSKRTKESNDGLLKINPTVGWDKTIEINTERGVTVSGSLSTCGLSVNDLRK